ncbi:MAG: radical SAM protein [Proteobacteria bacterium]|nr:radical SAM protein [Pseudomonadota bacterium]
MRVLLVEPSYYRDNGKINRLQRVRISPSLSILLVAGLTPPDVEVDFVREIEGKINFDDPADLIGITAMIHQASRAYEISAEFRKRGKTVVIGGIHATMFPEEVKANCDTVVVGEAEGVWTQLIRDFQKHQLKPFYKADRLHDLKNIPPPRYDLARKKGHYLYIPIWSSRGCPYNCDFCCMWRIYGGKFRKRPIEDVVRDVEVSKRKRTFFLADDNFSVDRSYTKELLKALIPLKIEWVVESEIRVAEDEELLDLMRESGCLGAYLGMESLNLKNLNEVDKGFANAERYREYLRRFHEHGVPVAAGLMFGFDEDSKETFKSTLDFLVENHVHYLFAHLLVPVPGSKLWERLETEGRMIPERHRKFSYYEGSHATFYPKNMTPEELEKYCWDFYRAFYSFPSFFKRVFYKPIRFRNLSATLRYHFFLVILNLVLGLWTRLRRYPVAF